MRLDIQRPNPDPPEEMERESRQVTTTIHHKHTSALQVIAIELRELPEHLVLVFRSDAGSGVRHFHSQQPHRIHSRLTMEMIV